ncbi:CRISPR-associated protein Cas4 [Sulfuracidifex tepidarius]|uniref:CRISPR-associated exonuclease Cas4 n=1 Tax=Sulfuracidifex tepidarius TaxID=1294262 RepID=A0A510E5I8_9CREN|nr:CRISPR-associated protein Cas4 [Sulfuracidifex tepidarius]BBG27746.1 CRISPR-associated exonuclease Cas4 [Sulfuracidifex tepidarius]
MITGTTVKHYVYCPRIVHLEALGFRERVTQYMVEGKEKEEEAYEDLSPKLPLEKGKFYSTEGLSGFPDFIVRGQWISPLDVKVSNKVRLDHKAEVLFYCYLMELSGERVKEGMLYYLPVKKLVRLNYSSQEREYVKRIIKEIIISKITDPKVRQPVRKCLNCGFRRWCNPRLKSFGEA